MSAQEATYLDDRAKVEQSVDSEELATRSTELGGSHIVGFHWDINKGYVVSVSDSIDPNEVEEMSRSLRSWSKLGENLTVRVVPGAANKSEVAVSYDRLKTRAEKLEALDIASFWVDETCGVLVIEVEASADVREIDRYLNDQMIDVPYIVEVIPKSDLPQVSDRNGYKNPYLGGTYLEILHSPTVGKSCTAAYGFYKSGGATQYWGMVAAHCMGPVGFYVPGSLGTVGRNWIQGNHDIDINSGHSTNYFIYGGPHDVAVVQLEIAAGNGVITRDPPVGPDQVTHMNWWQWSSGQDIVGHTFCQAGVTSNTPRCGPLLTKTWSKYWPASQSGIANAVIVNNMRLVNASALAGDSGGTAYRQSGSTRWIAGVVHAAAGGTFVYGHVSYARNSLGLTAPVQMS